MTSVAGLAGALALLGGTAVWIARRRLVVVSVTGTSMRPSLHEGERVLVRRVPLNAIRAGMVVVFAHPDRATEPPPGPVAGAAAVRLHPRAATDDANGWLIKRAVAVPGEPVPPELCWGDETVPADCLVVYGDNLPVSHDSRHFGYVRRGDVRGVVVGRAGRSPAPDRTRLGEGRARQRPPSRDGAVASESHLPGGP